MEFLIENRNVRKVYPGNSVALDGVNLNLQAGKIVGLLGPNGSGKTTLMKIWSGLLRQTSGEVEIMGNIPGVLSKKDVAFLPDINPLYKWMRPSDAIDYYDDMFEDFDRTRATELTTFMNIDPNQRVSQMSKGQAERTLLMLTLARDAKLLVLDEPLGGIDPVAKSKIIDSLIRFKTPSSVIVVSTHLVKDIERLFDEVVFLKQGVVTLYDDCEALRSVHEKSIEQIYIEVFGDE